LVQQVSDTYSDSNGEAFQKLQRAFPIWNIINFTITQQMQSAAIYDTFTIGQVPTYQPSGGATFTLEIYRQVKPGVNSSLNLHGLADCWLDCAITVDGVNNEVLRYVFTGYGEIWDFIEKHQDEIYKEVTLPYLDKQLDDILTNK